MAKPAEVVFAHAGTMDHHAEAETPIQTEYATSHRIELEHE
jgi:hypothetical protein